MNRFHLSLLLGILPHGLATVLAAILLNDYQDAFLIAAPILLLAHLIAIIVFFSRTGIPASLILSDTIASIASYLICFSVILTESSALDGSGLALLIYGGIELAAVLLLYFAARILRSLHSRGSK